MLRYRLVPWLFLGLSVALLGGAVVATLTGSGAELALVLVAICFGLGSVPGFRMTYVVSDGRLTTTGARGRKSRRTVALSSIGAAHVALEPVSATSRGWVLALYDRHGSVVKMRFDGTSPRRRRQLMSLLAPHILAPNVDRYGPVEQALAGTLWWPRGSREPAPPRGSRSG